MRRIGYDPDDYKAVLWNETGNARVVCVETPVSFVPSGYRKEPIDVKVEPGMFFVRSICFSNPTIPVLCPVISGYMMIAIRHSGICS